MKTRRKFLREFAATSAFIGCAPTFLYGSTITNGHSLPNTGEFLTACADGDLAKVKSLLKSDITLLSAKDAIGRSGFAIALLAGFTEIGTFLKQEGYQPDLHESVLNLDWDRYDELLGEESEETQAKINSNHPMGGTVMWAAAAGGAGIDMWRIYAKCGDPNITNGEMGSTPVQKALRFFDLGVAERTTGAILSNNANVDPIDNVDSPPLHIAAERGSFMMVEMLVRLGADVNRKGKSGYLAVNLAEKFGHKEVYDLLTNHASIPRTCRTSRTAFNADGQKYEGPDFSDIPLYLRRRLVGQAHGNLDYVKKEVEADPRMAHCVATTSEICVEACAHTGRKPVVEYLISKGAPYSLPTAVMLNDFTTVNRLLQQDPNRIHERGAHDFGLLWYPVIGQCDIEMAELLLEKGAKVEDQHFLGSTALHWACQRNRMDLVELFIENGANVSRIGYKFKPEGETPLQSTDNPKIINYLKSKGAKF